MQRILIAAMMALLVCGVTTAATINVPADHATIQAAVDAASGGDEILVAPGTYTGTGIDVVNMLGKAITLRASGAPEETIIDGEGARHVVYCANSEGADTVIEGFTITGGYGGYGCGIYCDYSSPTITGCTITGNTASDAGYGKGGGIYCYSSSPTISDCTISNNTCDYSGGGISCEDSSPTITGCTISGNTAGYGGGINYAGNGNSNPTINGCTITGNTATTGGGIYCNSSSPTITGCTISGNTSDYGGGITCTNSNLTLENVTLLGNSTPEVVLDNGSTLTQGNTQQELIAQMQDQIETQQSAIEDLQQVIEACCVERTCTGDENKDGVVNIEDLLIVISVWGPCP